MSRVTEAEVRAIMLDIDPNLTDLSPFITAANLLVTQVCTDSSLSDALLKEIERWLSAHYVCMADPRLMSEGIQSAKDVYESKVDLGLDVSRYGQQAKRLDTSGALARLDKQKRPVTFYVLDPVGDSE